MQITSHNEGVHSLTPATVPTPSGNGLNLLEPRPETLRFLPRPEEAAGVLPIDAYQANEGIFHAHDLEINTRTHEVKRAGKVIALTRYEFSLLEYLVSRQGEIVTRAQIRDRLYRHNEHRSNVIDAHICYLRHKIDKGFAFPLILTRWGEGYLFRSEERRPPAPQSGEIYW